MRNVLSGAGRPVLGLAAAMLLPAVSPEAMAQTESTLPKVVVTGQEESTPASKTSLRARQTRIGKGLQDIKDIPQSVTVMTELLMDDRNLDDFREVLRSTAGVTFQAGETGEEDVRMRGFSLGQAGDIYVDGMRDAPLLERDTFNLDRVDVLKGSASMLFGKGSTGGVVNQVSKQAFGITEHEVDLTLGSGSKARITGDFNWYLGDDRALRLNVMKHNADNGGAAEDKTGVAPTYRWGIGQRNEFSVGFYHLKSEGVPLYNHPWLQDSAGRLIPTLPAEHYYGLASDHLNTQSNVVNVSHTHRFDASSELKTQVRVGEYERDLWASVIRFCGPGRGGAVNDACPDVTMALSSLDQVQADTVLTRTAKGRVGKSTLIQVQSDYSGRHQWGGVQHDILAGVDISQEDAKRNNNFSGGSTSLTTTVGTPNDGDARADERGSPAMNTFEAKNIGIYLQDTLALSPHWKLVGGLRVDAFSASYRDVDGYSKAIDEVLTSPRLGVTYQPNATSSYYASYGTSYNTSGDTYQFALGSLGEGSNNEKLANTPPEQSRNLEVGAKFDLFDDRALLGVAVFRSEKYNERNTDADSAATQYLLSGKRHATGMEFNLAGRITPQWELFWNHTWIPSAKIDQSNVTSGNAQREGDRPGLTPKHSGSVWTTYRWNSQWRSGLGLNYRSEQNPEGNRAITAKAYATAEAMAEYAVSERTTLKLNVSNLTDELYAEELYRGFYKPGAGRRIDVSLKHLF